LIFIFDNPSGSGGLLSEPGPMTREREGVLDLDHERQPETGSAPMRRKPRFLLKIISRLNPQLSGLFIS
jgi:hypothetical protein